MPIHDGLETYCETPDGARTGPYSFTSSTLKARGSYIDGVRDDAWVWIPYVGAPRHHRYDDGVLMSESSVLLGLRHGFVISRWPRRLDALLEVPPIRDASYYLCGREVWRRSWDMKGVERIVQPQFEQVPAAHEECMKVWLASRVVPLHPLLPPEPSMRWPQP